MIIWNKPSSPLSSLRSTQATWSPTLWNVDNPIIWLEITLCGWFIFWPRRRPFSQILQLLNHFSKIGRFFAQSWAIFTKFWVLNGEKFFIAFGILLIWSAFQPEASLIVRILQFLCTAVHVNICLSVSLLLLCLLRVFLFTCIPKAWRDAKK